jgi:hypothetical protein
MIMRWALVSITVLNLAVPVSGYSETRLLNEEVVAFSDMAESSICCSNEDWAFQGVIAQTGGYDAAAPDVQTDQGNESPAIAEPPQSALEFILSAVMGFASSVPSQR